MAENSLKDIMAYFSTPDRPVTSKEMGDAEKQEWKSSPLIQN